MASLASSSRLRVALPYTAASGSLLGTPAGRSRKRRKTVLRLRSSAERDLASRSALASARRDGAGDVGNHSLRWHLPSAIACKHRSGVNVSHCRYWPVHLGCGPPRASGSSLVVAVMLAGPSGEPPQPNGPPGASPTRARPNTEAARPIASPVPIAARGVFRFMLASPLQALDMPRESYRRFRPGRGAPVCPYLSRRSIECTAEGDHYPVPRLPALGRCSPSRISTLS